MILKNNGPSPATVEIQMSSRHRVRVSGAKKGDKRTLKTIASFILHASSEADIENPGIMQKETIGPGDHLMIRSDVPVEIMW